MFFPQLGIHIEIDEGHHRNPKVSARDGVRDADIIDATGHEVIRIDVTCSIEQINQSVQPSLPIMSETLGYR
jgi:very-short-patch-repair endonuclease